jgi:hypothetical protein
MNRIEKSVIRGEIEKLEGMRERILLLWVSLTSALTAITVTLPLTLDPSSRQFPSGAAACTTLIILILGGEAYRYINDSLQEAHERAQILWSSR